MHIYLTNEMRLQKCGEIEEDNWQVDDRDEQAEAGFPPDPMWTESNWEPSVPSLQFFQVIRPATCPA